MFAVSDLTELPMHLCSSGDGRGNPPGGVGLRSRDLPRIKQQNKFIPLMNQGILNNLVPYADPCHTQRSRYPQILANELSAAHVKGIASPMRHADNIPYGHASEQFSHDLHHPHYYVMPPSLPQYRPTQNSYTTGQLPSPVNYIPSCNPFDARNRNMIPQTVPLFYACNGMGGLQNVVPEVPLHPRIFHRNIIPRRVDYGVQNEDMSSMCKEISESKVEPRRFDTSSEDEGDYLEQSKSEQRGIETTENVYQDTPETRSLNTVSDEQNKVEEQDSLREVVSEKSSLKSKTKDNKSSNDKDKTNKLNEGTLYRKIIDVVGSERESGKTLQVLEGNKAAEELSERMVQLTPSIIEKGPDYSTADH